MSLSFWHLRDKNSISFCLSIESYAYLMSTNSSDLDFLNVLLFTKFKIYTVLQAVCLFFLNPT
jgi:hypothetical protein